MQIQMNMSVKSMADRLAIRDVLERYCRGIDRLDAELTRSVYWDDATDDHGVFKGPGHGFVDFVMPRMRARYDGTMHCLHQSLLEVEGARAKSETYFVAYQWGHKQEQRFIDIAGGRYVDVLHERHGEWRIFDRVVVVEWTRHDEGLQAMPLPVDTFVQSRRDRQDIAYGRG